MKITLSIGILSILLVAACGKDFKPGKMAKYENARIGFSVMIPDNLQKTEEGNRVTLNAEGFPTILISLEATSDKSGRGSGGSSGMGEVTRKVFAPMRKLTCHCAKTEKFEDLVKKICRSLTNTREAPKNPSVVLEPVEVNGALKNAEAYKKGLEGLKDKIAACWKEAVSKDADFPAGHLSYNVVFAPDGTQKSFNVSRTFNHPKHQPLTECVEQLFKSVKPEMGDSEVKVRLYLKFELY